LKITRYPYTKNRSLRAWSAADEYVLKQCKELDLSSKSIVISNDQFGFLSCHLHQLNPVIVIERKSQEKSIKKNLAGNNLNTDSLKWISPLTQIPNNTDLGILYIPKSMDLYRLYLQQIHSGLSDQGTIICSFMTRHFTPQILSIAEEYFEGVEQSLAWKKSRLLTLTGKKVAGKTEITNKVPSSFMGGEVENLKQYYGVFSASNIDYATQFLLDHLELKETDRLVMDLASGNGVIGRAIQLKKSDTELHLVDDSILAIESSKLNLDVRDTHFHWNDTLEDFKNQPFDLVVTNPPFHFGHENNIEISTRLFQDAARILKKNGRFICVANQHLNYKTHLNKNFEEVSVLASNEKFVVYECTKSSS